MEAIFLACGAGGPQLKRNPLGANAMIAFLFALQITIAGSLSGASPCRPPSSDAVARTVQESPAFRVAVAATAAGDLATNRAAVRPNLDSLTAELYSRACSQLAILQPDAFPIMRLAWFTAYFGIEMTPAVFAVTGSDDVVLLSPISAGVLRKGLDLAAWQSVAPPLSADAPDSVIAQYICVVLMLTANHGVHPTCDLPFGIEIHRGKRLSVRTTTEVYDFVFDEAGHLAEVSRVGA